jgi:hypothetical protein
MYPSLGVEKDSGWADFRWDFPKWWKRYLGTGSVLTDAELSSYADKYQHRDVENIHLLYLDLAPTFVPERAGALKEWFQKHFEPMHSGYNIWHSEFLRHLESTRRSEATITCPIAGSQWQALQEFCSGYRDTRVVLERRFSAEIARAKETGPSTWEAVLQTFPFESGAGGDYPWLDNIQGCLILNAFRFHWNKLREKVGNNAMETFLDWVRQDSKTTFGQDYLPEDPVLFSA